MFLISVKCCSLMVGGTNRLLEVQGPPFVSALPTHLRLYLKARGVPVRTVKLVPPLAFHLGW